MESTLNLSQTKIVTNVVAKKKKKDKKYIYIGTSNILTVFDNINTVFSVPSWRLMK